MHILYTTKFLVIKIQETTWESEKHLHVSWQQVCRGTDGQAGFNILTSRKNLNSQMKNLVVWKVKQSATGQNMGIRKILKYTGIQTSQV